MESVRGNAWVSARLPSGSLARLGVTQDTCGFFCSRTSVRRVGPTTALCGTYLGRLSLLMHIEAARLSESLRGTPMRTEVRVADHVAPPSAGDGIHIPG